MLVELAPKLSVTVLAAAPACSPRSYAHRVYAGGTAEPSHPRMEGKLTFMDFGTSGTGVHCASGAHVRGCMRGVGCTDRTRAAGLFFRILSSSSVSKQESPSPRCDIDLSFKPCEYTQVLLRTAPRTPTTHPDREPTGTSVSPPHLPDIVSATEEERITYNVSSIHVVRYQLVPPCRQRELRTMFPPATPCIPPR
ncbi:hypothetical protein K438DRAFT_2025880 [Mycena galopus ATCC 62051]|nr:hypothetical protein K438DRAFT_2025880 [Mycena galopus ATCC 62051]